MIKDSDRSGWFGGSDANMVLRKNYSAKTFKKWWAVKLGEQEPDFKGSAYTDAGNKYEHPILLAINDKMNLDRQIKVEKLLLRVNYDGDFNGTIYEVKTHKSEKDYEVSITHWRQSQVEMYAYKEMEEKLGLPPFKRLYIVSCGLYPDEYYGSREIQIDLGRVKFHEIAYDKQFIKGEYLPCLKEKARALRKGKFLS